MWEIRRASLSDRDALVELCTAASLLRAIPAVGHRLGAREVHAFLPHDPRILGAAKAAGYRRETWGQEAILFERRIDLGPTSYRWRPTYAELAARRREESTALALDAGIRALGHGPTPP